MLRFFLILIISLICFSCANRNGHLISFNLPDYNYDYKILNKSIDKNKTYYLASTIYYESFPKRNNNESVRKYFKGKLKNNLIIENQLKDKEGKLVLLNQLDYDVTKNNLNVLSDRIVVDFIILSKIEYLEFLDKSNLSKNNNARLISALAGAIASIKIIDVNNNEVVLEMSCTASVNDSKYHFEEAIDNQGPVIETTPVYKQSFSLGEKAMKKLLKKIK